MAKDKAPTDIPATDDSGSRDADPNKSDLDGSTKPNKKNKNVPTMMEPVMEAPENIDLDLLDIPILTNKVEQHVDDPATRQDPQSDNET